MVKQVIDNNKYNKLKLSQEEKDIFFDFVNLLPKGIYDKSNKIDFQFLEAMKCGETQKAFDYLCQLSWNQIALKILTYAKNIKLIQAWRIRIYFCKILMSLLLISIVASILKR